MKDADTINSTIAKLRTIKTHIKFLEEDVIPAFSKGHEHEGLFEKLDSSVEAIAEDAAAMLEIIRSRDF